jgi:hypothetical protein
MNFFSFPWRLDMSENNVYMKDREKIIDRRVKELFLPRHLVEKSICSYEDEILNHPAIKPLVESGVWDKMPDIHQRWLIEDLFPWPLEARQAYMRDLEEMRTKYQKSLLDDPD